MKLKANQEPSHRPQPAWIKPLLLATSLLIILRVTGVIRIPKNWVIGAAVLDVGLAIFEMGVFIGVMRHFYGRHRASGMGKIDAITISQVDELRAAGLSERLAQPLEKAILFEIKIYKKIYGLFRILLKRDKQS